MFEINAIIPVEKTLAKFFCIIADEKQHGIFYYSPEGIFTNIVQVRRSLPQDQKDRWKEC